MTLRRGTIVDTEKASKITYVMTRRIKVSALGGGGISSELSQGLCCGFALLMTHLEAESHAPD